MKQALKSSGPPFICERGHSSVKDSPHSRPVMGIHVHDKPLCLVYFSKSLVSASFEKRAQPAFKHQDQVDALLWTLKSPLSSAV